MFADFSSIYYLQRHGAETSTVHDVFCFIVSGDIIKFIV